MEIPLSPRRACQAFMALLLIPATVFAQQDQQLDTAPSAVPAGTVRAWEHDSSDIAVDPRIHFGSLKNGMRFAWAQNPEPKERVYVRLHVDAGSFGEQDMEVGMAHFLEHMAFNGSTHFEAGTLIEWFQENGMSFGADTNAHTAFSETVYKLDLPNNDEKTIRDGLQVLRDFASELDLLDEEIQAEKGVIDGEERERDSAGFRAFVQQLNRQYAGTLLATRLPIGTKEVRDQFNDKNVRAFYERWYRPENMTLVVVGDLAGLELEPLIHEIFDDMKSQGTAVMPEPKLGKPSMDDLNFAIFNDELPSVQMTIAMLKPYQDRLDNIAQRTENLPRGVAHAMLNLRLSEVVKKAGTSFLSAGIGGAGGMKVFEGGSLNVSADPQKWEAAMTEAYTELRKALNFGFQQAELEEIRASFLRGLDEAVEREPKAHSKGLLAGILSAVENGGVPSDAQTDRQVILEALNALTVEACLDALRKDWRGGEMSITAVGGLDLPNAPAEFKRVFEAARKIKIERPDAVERKAWAYASDVKNAGKVISKTHVEDLDIWLVEFENGVRLNLKKTDFKENQVLMTGRLGCGTLSVPEDELIAGFVGSMVFSAGGLGEHSSDDLRRLTAGLQVSLGVAMGTDHISVNGATTAEDMLMQFELLCASIEHSGYRPDGLTMLAAQLPLVFQQFKHTPMGPLSFDFAPELFQGNPRLDLFGVSVFPSLEELQAVDMEAIRKVYEPRLQNAPLELAVVGDFEVDVLIAQAAQTLGALPMRDPAKGECPPTKGSLKQGIYMERFIETQDEKVTLMMIFPTTDGFDYVTRRNLTFLGKVVDDRLRLEVRERLGAAYSPGAQAESSSVVEGLGGIMISANGDPEKLKELVEACRNVASELMTNGVTQEEVDRLSEPMVNQVRDGMRSNGFWLRGLSKAQSDPAVLDGARTMLDFYSNIDPKAISDLAAMYMNPERASTLVVIPKS